RDVGPRAECPLQEAAANRIFQRDCEGDVGCVRLEQFVEGQHVDVEHNRPRVIRQPEPRRRAEAYPERPLHVVCRKVDPASLFIEAILDLGDAPHDALSQEGLAPDRAEANRDPLCGGMVCCIPGGRVERRRGRPEEARWIRGAQEATAEYHESDEQPPEGSHRVFVGETPSPCGPRRSTLGSRSRESARVRTDSSASRSATRLACSSSCASPTPFAACPTDAAVSRTDAVVAPRLASSSARPTRVAAARSSRTVWLKDPSSAPRPLASVSIDPRVFLRSASVSFARSASIGSRFMISIAASSTFFKVDGAE